MSVCTQHFSRCNICNSSLRCLYFLCVAIALGSATCATAQTPTKKDIPAADVAFRKGYAAVQAHDFTTAEKEFAEVVRLSPNVAVGHSAYGSVLLSQGKPAAAVRELEIAHRLDPAESSAISNLARAYEQTGQSAKALSLYDDEIGRHRDLGADTSIDYAQLLLAAGRVDDAQTLLRQATEKEPENASLQDALGVVYIRQQQLGAAEKQFAQAVALDAAAPLPHLHLGTTLLLELKLTDAIRELTTAQALQPASLEAALQLGKAYSAAHREQAAIDILRQATLLAPSSVDAKYQLALALQNAGRLEDALPLFAETVDARPEDAEALTNYGLALLQTGKAKEALAFYQRALQIDKGKWILREDMGVAYLQQNDLDHAMEQFQDGLKLDPDNAQLHYDLGLSLKLKDRIPDAIAELQLAEKYDATLPDPPYTLGVLLMQTGRFAEAADQLTRATDLRPEYGQAWAVLGSNYKSMDQPDRAIAALLTAARLLPAQPGNHINLAAIYAQQGRHDEAVAERKIAAELSRKATGKQHANFSMETGKGELKQGRFDEAVKQFEDAIAADPQSAEAHRLLAGALAQQGKSADAAVERQKAESLQTAQH